MHYVFAWSDEKNEELKVRYGFGFEQVVIAIESGLLLINRTHPNVETYGHQRQFIVEIERYAWVVPFVPDGETTFLKTMFPSRKATRLYLGREL
jgi:hypothetical protein